MDEGTCMYSLVHRRQTLRLDPLTVASTVPARTRPLKPGESYSHAKNHVLRQFSCQHCGFSLINLENVEAIRLSWIQGRRDRVHVDHRAAIKTRCPFRQELYCGMNLLDRM